MADLVFEIGTEELPSWYVEQAETDVVDLSRRLLDEARLSFDQLEGFATPRRIAVTATGLAEATSVRTELRRGPPASVAFDAAGAPAKAAVAFARASGVSPESLLVRDTDRGRYVFAEVRTGGERAVDVLPALLARLVGELPAPRKMRWGSVKTPFVRPVAWLLALLDTEVVPVVAAGVEAARFTRGHRFLSRGCIEVASAHDYVASLEGANVLPGGAVRREATWRAVAEAAGGSELHPVRDDALLAEVSNLVEYPFALLGEFDARFLALPEPVLTTTMIHHQRFFPVRRTDGALAAAFVGVSNNRVPDEEVVRTGYRRVLEGRLYDADFFWHADRRTSLAEHAENLAGIGYHRKLGSVKDKVERVAGSAARLAELIDLAPEEDGALAEASALFKADLATEMVTELPELEGVMARCYGLAEGIGLDVAEALEEGVMPRGSAGPLPASRVGAVLSVCDRVDTLLAFFAVGERPSGSADPFGLRRQALALSRVLCRQGWRVPLSRVLGAGAGSLRDAGIDVSAETVDEAARFVWERITGLLGEEGVAAGLVKAACADDPPVVLAARRAHLLARLGGSAEFESLMLLYKRAANLAREASTHVPVQPELFAEPYELRLWEAIAPAREAIDRLVTESERQLAPWDLGHEPMRELKGVAELIAGVLALKPPLDEFLDHVLVMVDDSAVRENRLALLRSVRDALKPLGALERLEGLQA